ncbi:MAG: hypothetical protein J7647_30260, partial [Cyanobacteria bacterium SBLK]|nr:hypothetical protein [Cyanobacteria bacterium SBLK]
DTSSAKELTQQQSVSLPSESPVSQSSEVSSATTDTPSAKESIQQQSVSVTSESPVSQSSQVSTSSARELTPKQPVAPTLESPVSQSSEVSSATTDTPSAKESSQQQSVSVTDTSSARELALKQPVAPTLESSVSQSSKVSSTTADTPSTKESTRQQPSSPTSEIEISSSFSSSETVKTSKTLNSPISAVPSIADIAQNVEPTSVLPDPEKSDRQTSEARLHRNPAIRDTDNSELPSTRSKSADRTSPVDRLLAEPTSTPPSKKSKKSAKPTAKLASLTQLNPSGATLSQMPTVWENLARLSSLSRSEQSQRSPQQIQSNSLPSGGNPMEMVRQMIESPARDRRSQPDAAPKTLSSQSSLAELMGRVQSLQSRGDGVRDNSDRDGSIPESRSNIEELMGAPFSSPPSSSSPSPPSSSNSKTIRQSPQGGDIPDAWSNIEELIGTTSSKPSQSPPSQKQSNVRRKTSKIESASQPSPKQTKVKSESSSKTQSKTQSKKTKSTTKKSFRKKSTPPAIAPANIQPLRFPVIQRTSDTSSSKMPDIMRDAEEGESVTLTSEDNGAATSDNSTNLEILAREIYKFVRQRLVLERERRGSGYSGRLPW